MRNTARLGLAVLGTLGAAACSPGEGVEVGSSSPVDAPAGQGFVAPKGPVVVVPPRTVPVAPKGSDALPAVELARRQEDGSLLPISGRYIEALEFRDGMAAVTADRQLKLLRNNGSLSVVAKQLDGLPTRTQDGSLVYAARFGEVVELYRLRENGESRRLAALRGSATRLSPRPNGTVVFIGSRLGEVSGIWLADSKGAHCITNCGLLVGKPWGDAYHPPPGETDTVRIVGSRIEWQAVDGTPQSAPLGVTLGAQGGMNQ